MTDAQASKALSPTGSHRLADFIRQNMEPIVSEWVAFAKTRTPACDGMTKLALRDHVQEILTYVADDIDSFQTDAEQFDKSRGLAPPDSPSEASAAETHAELRLADGFDLDQMVSEYRALRASVVKQWMINTDVFSAQDIEDLTRFNEAMDQAMSESVAHYTKSINHSRSLFLGILGHDLRTPIGAALMAANLVKRIDSANEKQVILTSQIITSMERATHILNDLLEITRSSFGTEIPAVKTPMDMADLAREIVEETCAVSKDRKIGLTVVGNTEGQWDKARIGQALSNLLSNAVQYSSASSSVEVTVTGKDKELLISVHNHGSPIPENKIKSIFDSLTRGLNGDEERQGSVNLGLGLYIAKKIMDAHQGKLEVVSTQETGTTFTATLPK